MLEQMRKNSHSLLITILFLVVIAVFIINFGPQSRGGSCESTFANDHFAAKVAGDTVTTNDFRYAFLVLGGAQVPAKFARQERLKETVMDKLIERELLAQEAERLGYVVTEEEVEDLISDAKIIGLGYRRSVPRLQKDGKFNYEAFKSFVQFELGVTPKAFIEQQKRELLAARVRDLFRNSVTVSADEVKADYLRKNRQVNLEYVRFSPARYAAEVAPSEAEIAEYAKDNDAKLRAAYQEQKLIYEKKPKELRLREILIKTSDPASPEADKAAEKKAEAAAARVKKGEPFAKVAKETSQDAASRGRGGDIGWRSKGATNLAGDAEDKLFAAKTGDVVGPVKGTGGFYVLKVEGAREGNVPFEQAKLDLAEEQLRQQRVDARAKADAEAALARARQSGGKTLKELYPAPADDKGEAKGDTDAPRAEETGMFAPRWMRDGLVVEGIGPSTALAKAAFSLTPASPLAGPFQVAGTYVIVRLKERKEPDLAELEKKKLDLVHDAEQTKFDEVLTDWTHNRCVEARDGKRIQINPDVLRYEDSSEPPPYEPCSSRRFLGG